MLLSDTTLLDRTPVERSAAGFPMSHFDKDDVEEMGLLKLDVLGIRMQSSMAHAIDEIERTTGERIELDASALDDEQTFDLIRSTRTLGWRRPNSTMRCGRKPLTAEVLAHSRRCPPRPARTSPRPS